MQLQQVRRSVALITSKCTLIPCKRVLSRRFTRWTMAALPNR